MNVFVAIDDTNDYDKHFVIGVFTTRDAADAALPKYHGGTGSIIERILDRPMDGYGTKAKGKV